MKKILQILSVPVLLIIGAAGWSILNTPTQISITRTASPSPIQTVPTNIPTNIPVTIPASGGVATPTAVITDATPLVYANPSVVIDAIKTAVPDKNYPDLLPLMTANVTLIKYGTSCCGLIPKAQAVSELSYLNNAVLPWDFSDRNPIAAKIETNDPDHFTGMMIGTSANFQAVGFKWNDEFLIEKISIVGDYHLITGQ